MTANFSETEPDELYTRDFLIRVPKAYPQDSQTTKGKRPSNVLSFVVSCFAMAAMFIYQLASIRAAGWDNKMVILVFLTGVVSFALAHIFTTLYYGEK